MPPLGYDVAPGGGRLVVNPAEADQVRAIFEIYLQERSLLRCVEVLNGRGWRTKSWTTQKGTLHEGGRFDKTGLRGLLRNAIYIGKVGLKGQLYDGEHPGIVDLDLFARVGEMLAGGQKDRSRAGNKHGFLLRGLVRCVTCGSAMTSATSSPRGKHYRYYSCTAVRRRGNAECPVRAVAAAELEAFIVERIRGIGRDPALLQETLRAAAEDRQREQGQLEQERRMLQAEHQRCQAEARRLPSAALDERAVQIETRLSEIQRALAAIEGTDIEPSEAAKALAQFDPVWDALVPREQASLLQLLIERVDYDPKEVAITFRPTGLASLAGEQRSAA